ncbi:hypothetical protein TNCV_486521 [Trichonephila clavipes]|nr:hypothetical protein TNCV_486521 [Trichonephila clavipes]
MAQDRGTEVKKNTTPTSQLISGRAPRHTHIRWNPMETHLFPLTKSSQIGNNIQTSIDHNLWLILQI